MNNDNRNPKSNATTTQSDQPKRDDDKKVAGVPGEHDKKQSKEGGDKSQSSQK